MQSEPRDFPDRSIRQQLQNAANLRELLEVIIPELAPQLDFDGLQALDRTFLLDDWRSRESDLLFSLPYRTEQENTNVLICILIEHQSQPDPRMPLRMLVYTVLFWEREWREWEKSQTPRVPLRLTPVLPIMFHTGAVPWRTNRDLAALVACPEAFRPYVPHWQPLFWDLAEKTPQELLDAAGAWLKALAVVRAEGEEREKFLEVLQEVLRRLEGLEAKDRNRWIELLHFLLSWALHRRPAEEREEVVERARSSQEHRQRQEEVRTVGQTIAEALIAEGMAKGKAEGKLEDAREILRNLLLRKFKTLPVPVIDRIAAASDHERLKACINAVFDMTSLDQLGL